MHIKPNNCAKGRLLWGDDDVPCGPGLYEHCTAWTIAELYRLREDLFSEDGSERCVELMQSWYESHVLFPECAPNKERKK